MRIGSLVHIPIIYRGSGNASSTGFILNNDGKSVKSKNYKKDGELKFGKKCLIFWGIICAFCALVLLKLFFGGGNAFSWINVLIFAICATVLTLSNLILTAAIFFSDIFGGDIKECHACEHKIFALLADKKLEPTIENLERMPRITSDCGTIIMAVTAILPIGLLLWLAIINSLKINSIVLTILLLILFFIAPFIIQFFCTTAKPSQEKLEEALEVAKQFYK